MPSKIEFNLAYILVICGVAALGGLLLGYDTAVISGAINPITRYFNLDSVGMGWAVSNVAVGCIVGAFASGWVAAKFGRKNALILAAVLFSISAIGSALAENFALFIVYRMVGGLAVGIASSVSPMYMSEVSPRNIRGRALSMQNFAIVFGQIVIFVVNYLIAKGATGAWLDTVGWRIMIGSEAIPCAIFVLASFFIPESPRWHVMIGKETEALKTLTKIFKGDSSKQILAEIKESIHSCEVEEKEMKKTNIWKEKTFWFIAFLACAVAFFQQASGVNVMMYFAPVVLENVTGNTEVAMFMTIWVGVVQLIGTIMGSLLMDKVGRIPLLKVGSVGASAGLLITSYFLYKSSGVTGDAAISMGYGTLFGMLFFMIFFAFSWSLGAWIVVSEIFPNRMRSVGMSLSIGALWVSNFLVGLFFPILNGNEYLSSHFHGAFPMWLFAGVMAVAVIFIFRFLPETKGVALEDMEAHIIAKRDHKSEDEVKEALSV
jgi:SP family xylose:H+ symportor-like MFS transporter